MLPSDILELAARHYNILGSLRKKPSCYYSELEAATSIPPSTLNGYMRTLKDAGLVKIKKKGNRNIGELNELGMETLEYIDKYERFVRRPSIDEELQKALEPILDLLEIGVDNKQVEDTLSRRLSELCRTHPEVLFQTNMQDFLIYYLDKQSRISEIDEIVSRVIKRFVENIGLKSWFYFKIYPIILKQFEDMQINEMIRITRLRFLWEIYLMDKGKREEILKYIIRVIESECKNQENEICKHICTSHPYIIREDLMKRLLKLRKIEILDRFFPNNIN
jgi:DNA-binding transcriptional ArsR family regulator